MKEKTATRSNKVIEKNILSLITFIGGEASLFLHSLINPDYTPIQKKWFFRKTKPLRDMPLFQRGNDGLSGGSR